MTYWCGDLKECVKTYFVEKQDAALHESNFQKLDMWREVSEKMMEFCDAYEKRVENVSYDSGDVFELETEVDDLELKVGNLQFEIDELKENEERLEMELGDALARADQLESEVNDFKWLVE